MNKNIIVPVKSDFHNAVRRKAASEGLPITDVVRGSLELYLDGKISIKKKGTVATVNELDSTGESL